MGKGMKAGKRPKASGMGGKGQKGQIEQLQAMQRQMEEAQAKLEEKEFETTAGGGAIKAVVN
ncbi:MAG: YbaB/EbfC family nucleoid-associated protein [Enterococcus sp.]|nr:YbaB/EbfC family nucleoid-associated protein [Enterococcus sp.]